VRWWTPDELSSIGAFARSLGFSHVEAGPLVRSSYHAKRAVAVATAQAASDATPTRTAVSA
jgi:lipoic acid synthetase